MAHRTLTFPLSLAPRLARLLDSPTRILGIVLLLVFCVEVVVMFLLPSLTPTGIGDAGRAILDAILLTLVCAPVLWWLIIGPLRRIAIQEQQRSQTIVANAGESIFTFDKTGMIQSCNRAATELFNRPADGLVGGAMGALIGGFPDRFDHLPMTSRLEAGEPASVPFPVQVSISEYPSESPGLFIAIVRDLTVSVQAEQERILMARQTEALRAQQMATLAQLATGVAHEIRNPLTSIKMLIQVNRAKFADEGLPTDDLELVEQEIRRMERSVNSLLDYGRPETGEFAPMALHEAIAKTSKLVNNRCQTLNITLQIDAPERPVIVNGDASQIQQLLLNLAINAMDAMPHGGELRVSLSQDDRDATIVVQDTGSGIDALVIENLFTPFVTTKPNGIGIGLGICRRIAEAHGGTLEGMNRGQGGAMFRFMIPLLKTQ